MEAGKAGGMTRDGMFFIIGAVVGAIVAAVLVAGAMG